MFTSALADARARGLAIFAALFVVSTFVLTGVAGATGDGHHDDARCARHSGHPKAGDSHKRHKKGDKKHHGQGKGPHSKQAGECGKKVPPPPAAPKGKIVITKQTDPDGSAQAFAFTAPGLDADGFVLKDGESATFDNLTPGTFTVSENATAGWTLKGIFCRSSSDDHKKHDDHKSGKGDDPKSGKGYAHNSWNARASGAAGDGDHSNAGVTVNGNAVTIDVAAGQTVSCVFKNRQVPPGAPLGTIVVAKATVPAGANASFAFTAPALDADGFALSDGQSVTFSGLAPGTYTVTESELAGWTLQTIACTDATSDTTVAGPAATIKVAAGETVTCTFTNAPVQPIAAPTPVTPGPAAQPSAPAPTSGALAETQRGVTPRATLGSPRRCVRTTYPVSITGGPISQISFSVNGRHVKTVRANGRSRVRTTLRMQAGRVQRVVARVNFTSNARPRSKTLRATVLRCQSVRGVLPTFTG